MSRSLSFHSLPRVFSSSFPVLSPYLVPSIVRPAIPLFCFCFFLLFIHRESLSLRNGQSLTPTTASPHIATQYRIRLSHPFLAPNSYLFLSLPCWRVLSPFARNEGLNPPNLDPCRVVAHRNYRVLLRSRHTLVLPCPLRHQAFFFFRPVYPPTLAPITCALA